MTWQRSSTSTDTLTLDAVKDYLRVNFFDDDPLISVLIATSLEYVDGYRQKPSLATSYSDQYGPFSVFPTELIVGETEAPTVQPQVFYTDTSGTEVELVASGFTYKYCITTRAIILDFSSQPDIQDDSNIRVAWSVAAVDPNSAITARKLMIGNWYENREATVNGANNSLEFGVNAVLSQSSLIM